MDFTKIEELIKDGYITKQKHPDAELWILNYSRKCQYEGKWTPETLQCRGLIINSNNNIVSRPFPKFFNFTELPSVGLEIPVETFQVYEKLDGSLGISYTTPNHYGVFLATRGSFTSTQALKGTQILREKYPDFINIYNPKHTYLFEIIYPENRIVVDYGDIEDVVLLDIIHTQSGVRWFDDRDYKEWAEMNEGLLPPVVRKFDGIQDFEQLKALEEKNKEGFVIRFASGFRVKIKFDEYVRLHKLLTGINKKTVWEWLKNGDDYHTLLTNIPDEFDAWIRNTAEDLLDRKYIIETKAYVEFKRIQEMNPQTRKDWAVEIVKQKHLAPILFNMLDEKDPSPVIWKMLKPTGDEVFKIEV